MVRINHTHYGQRVILVTNEQSIVPLDLDQIQRDTQKILNCLEYGDFDIGILFTTDEKIHKLNKDYRGKDRATDILSFPFYPLLHAGEVIIPEHEDEKNLGDIIIAPQFVKADLGRWEVSFNKRIQTLLAHGICHLLGYDHIADDDYELMKEKENWLLRQLTQ